MRLVSFLLSVVRFDSTNRLSDHHERPLSSDDIKGLRAAAAAASHGIKQQKHIMKQRRGSGGRAPTGTRSYGPAERLGRAAAAKRSKTQRIKDSVKNNKPAEFLLQSLQTLKAE